MKNVFSALVLAVFVFSANAEAATAVYFDHFEAEVHAGNVNLLPTGSGGDSFSMILSTGAPSASWTDNSDITGELSTASGYTQGGAAMVTTSSSQTSGTYTWVGTDVEWTLTGEISFRYAIINDTTADLLVCYCDFGSTQTANSSLTLNIGTLLTVSFASLCGQEFIDSYSKVKYVVRRIFTEMDKQRGSHQVQSTILV